MRFASRKVRFMMIRAAPHAPYAVPTWLTLPRRMLPAFRTWLYSQEQLHDTLADYCYIYLLGDSCCSFQQMNARFTHLPFN